MFDMYETDLVQVRSLKSCQRILKRILMLSEGSLALKTDLTIFQA